MDTVEVILNEKQAEELHQLLSQALGDLSSEIAATDNPAFKRSLRERRHQLHAIGLKLGYAPEG